MLTFIAYGALLNTRRYEMLDDVQADIVSVHLILHCLR